jgi:hypothetical protein
MATKIPATASVPHYLLGQNQYSIEFTDADNDDAPLDLSPYSEIKFVHKKEFRGKAIQEFAYTQAGSTFTFNPTKANLEKFTTQNVLECQFYTDDPVVDSSLPLVLLVVEMPTINAWGGDKTSLTVTASITENINVSVTTVRGIQGATGPAGADLNSENVVFVRANGTPTENATELLNAYATAKTLTPNGNPISATNRVVILCNTGTYEFLNSSNAPILDTDYIDIVSISGEKDLNFTLTTGTFESKIIDVRANCSIIGVYSTAYRFVVDGGLPNLYLKNCQGNFGSFGYGGYDLVGGVETIPAIQGRFESCKAGDWSFGAYTQGFEADCIDCEAGTNSFGRANNVNGYQVSGTLKRCKAGENSFGYKMLASGTFIDCESTGNYSFGCGEGATGTFIRCITSGTGMGRALGNAVDGTVCSGTFIDCSAGGFSYGYYADCSGVFRNCVGGSRSYGYGVEASGYFFNCSGGSNSYGSGTGGIASGHFEGCDAWQDAYGGVGGSLTGTLLHCKINNSSNPNFTTPSTGGKIINSFDGNDNIISVNSVPSGGTSGQALVKTSDDDYDVEWSAIEAGVTEVNSKTGAVTLNSDEVPEGTDQLYNQIVGIVRSLYEDRMDIGGFEEFTAPSGYYKKAIANKRLIGCTVLDSQNEGDGTIGYDSNGFFVWIDGQKEYNLTGIVIKEDVDGTLILIPESKVTEYYIHSMDSVKVDENELPLVQDKDKMSIGGTARLTIHGGTF